MMCFGSVLKTSGEFKCLFLAVRHRPDPQRAAVMLQRLRSSAPDSPAAQMSVFACVHAPVVCS